MNIFVFLIAKLPLLAGWGADRWLGDPEGWPHPVVWFGRCIAWCEHRFNHGRFRLWKGALMAIGLVMMVYWGTVLLFFCVPHLVLLFWKFTSLHPYCDGYRVGVLANALLAAVLIFYCLAGTTLVREVQQVFEAVDRSLEEGRRQVARIVGRDTMDLSAQEVRTAALETLAENLSDGVVAPLFWYILLGVPGMMAYKMINTLDSMVGYRTERYEQFGKVAARLDDCANYIPARLTALLMLLVAKRLHLLRAVWKNGPRHASPNSGYPEAALACIMGFRFGGPHYYFGQLFDKPYIGEKERPLVMADMIMSVRLNRRVEVVMVVLALLLSGLW